MDEKTRKVIIMSLAGMLVGSLLFIFGISITYSSIPLLIYFIIAEMLYISAFLSVYNNNKNNHAKIYVYLMVLSIVLAIICLYATLQRII
ncbi:MAG: hypothetical protein LUG60_10650 [Erysipelotrichaceae bacterium]|nr:hypothetical protein [Erysipelotrichaceae bacterium]